MTEATHHETLVRHTQFALSTDGGTVGALGHVSLSGLPSDGDLFVIGDGEFFEVFEFDDDASVSTSITAATGNVDLTSQPNDGDTVVLDDGINPPVTYEFDNNASVTESPTLQQVVIGGTAALTITNFISKVNTPAAGAVMGMSAAEGAADSADLTNTIANLGVRGNVAITESTAGVRITVTGMSGGTSISRAVSIGASVREALGNLLDDIQASALLTVPALAPVGNDRIVLRNPDDSGATGNTEIFLEGSNLAKTDFAGGGPKPLGILRIEGNPLPQILRGRIHNKGDRDITLEFFESANNNSIGVDGSETPDPYAAPSAIRVNGADVATGLVTVVAGGVEAFSLENIDPSASPDPYFRLAITSPADAKGTLGFVTMEQEAGAHSIRAREGTP